MYVRRLEQVIVDLVEVLDGPDVVGADEALAVEALQAAVDAHVRIEAEAGRRLALVGVDPLLDVDDARAVVDAVCDVDRLRVDGADLADDGDLRGRLAVDLQLGLRVGFFAVD
jgi:hypothetical protein